MAKVRHRKTRNEDKRAERERTRPPEAKSEDGTNCCSLLVRVFCYLGGIILACLLYAYATSPISSVVIDDYPDVGKLKWAKVANSDLANGEKVLKDLTGTESIVVDESGRWYTGVHDGRLLEITNGASPKPIVQDVTETAQYIAGDERQKRRALGIRLFGKRLYVADAYQGVFIINTHDKTWEKIVGYDDVEPAISFTNDLTVTRDEKTIYFTDTTTRRQYHEAAYSLAEGECSGRVFQVNINTKKVQLILDKLCFANGIQLNKDETKLLVSENTRARVIVVDIASRKVVKTIHLPGGPDNTRPAKGGGYWVPMPALHDPTFDITFRFTFIRDILAKLLGAEGLLKLVPKQGAVAKLSEEFEPVSVHYDLQGKVCQVISEVQEYEKGKYLVGSFMAQGIARISGMDSM